MTSHIFPSKILREFNLVQSSNFKIQTGSKLGDFLLGYAVAGCQPSVCPPQHFLGANLPHDAGLLPWQDMRATVAEMKVVRADLSIRGNASVLQGIQSSEEHPPRSKCLGASLQ